MKKSISIRFKPFVLIVAVLVGDVFIRIPVIEALKNKFQNAKIITIVDSKSLEVVEHQPCIDVAHPGLGQE